MREREEKGSEIRERKSCIYRQGWVVIDYNKLQPIVIDYRRNL